MSSGELKMDREKFLRLLSGLIAAAPHHVNVTPLASAVRRIARANDSHREEGRIVLGVPDEMIVNMRGEQARQDLIAIVRIPRSVVDRALSPIILPGVS